MAAGLRAGTAFVDVLPRIGAGFGNEISRNIDGDVQRAGESAGTKLGETIKKLALLAGGAFAVDKVKDFVQGSIAAASDLNETVSKSSIIFGDNAAEIDKWSRGSATALGLSRQKALEAAASFGDMFSQIGFGGKAAAAMSKDTVQLAADLGSFNNLRTDDVMDRISASLRGEFDSLQAVIPNINAARVEQEALAETGKKTAKELTAQEKAAATLAIIHKDGARAAGDFERTSSGLANQQKILSARMEDVKARIGTALLPIVVKLTTALSNSLGPAIDYISTLWSDVREVFSFPFGGQVSDDLTGFERIVVLVSRTLKGLYEAFRALFSGDDGPQGFGEIMDNLLGNSGKWVGMFRSIGTVILEVVGFIRDHLVPILIGLGIGFALLISPIGVTVAAIIFAYMKFELFRTIVDAVVSFFVNVAIPAIVVAVGYVSDVFSAFGGFVGEIWPSIAEAIRHTVNVISDVIRGFISAIGILWRLWGDDLLRIVDAVWSQIRANIDFAVNLVANLIRFVLAIINGDWGKAWDAIKNIFTGTWDFITATLRNLFGVFEGLFGGLFDLLRRLVVAGVEGIIGFWRDLPGRIIGAIGDLAGLLGRFFVWELGVAKDLAIGVLEGLIGYFRELPGKFLEAAGDVFGFLREAFRAAVNFIIRGWNALEFKIPEFDTHLPGIGKVGGFTLGVPDVPLLARGGIVLDSGSVIVGEDGPELLNLPRGANVAPLDGAGGKHYHLELSGVAYEPIDVAEQFRRMELLAR